MKIDSKLNTIEEAIIDLKNGKMIIVVDDENRENEGDFVMSAELATPETINFMATHGRGMICAPIDADLAHKLELPLQVQSNTSAHGTAFTVTIDATENISTGISSQDRSHTLKLMANPQTTARDFVRPGHIFPLISRKGGVLEREGHTEAAVDLCKISGLAPVGVICEIMKPDGTMARLDELMKMSREYNLKIISIEDLIKYRKTHDDLITQVESIPFKNKIGEFTLSVFRSEILDEEMMVLIKGSIALDNNPLIRLHSECLTGDVFHSNRCDCGDQLNRSMKMIEDAGCGIILYQRQEGRGIGLLNKIRAYELQDQGLDTVEANLKLGFKSDARDYTLASQVLKRLEISKGRLLSNNPFKLEALRDLGLTKLTLEPLTVDLHEQNSRYLFTKMKKFGHKIDQQLFN